MKLSVLTIVILRLFSIYWGVTALTGILVALGAINYMGITGISIAAFQYVVPFLSPVLYGMVALLTWRFTESISECVVGKTDPTLSFSEITAENLYTLGIFGLGMYYCLGFIGPLIQGIQALVFTRAFGTWKNQQSGLNLYQVSSQILPCVGGAMAAIAAPKIARRLVAEGLKLKQTLRPPRTLDEVDQG